MFELMVEETFDAAHQLIGYQGPCELLHGHTWKVQIFVTGEKLNEQGMVLDFSVIKKWLWKILKEFDHRCLNELKYFAKHSPTSENIAYAIFNFLKPKFKKFPLILKRVCVWESATTSTTYSPE